MSEVRQRNRFLSLLLRLRSRTGLHASDEASIRGQAVERLNRTEHEPRRDGGPQNVRDFYKTGVHKFRSRGAGLKAFGWKEVCEEGPEHSKGAYASIRLAYRRREEGKPLERRHLCAAKVQPLESFTVAWNEAEIMRAFVHENIVDFYGMFTVEPHPPLPNPDLQIERSCIWILLEYANAGDLRKEMARFENKRIPELGAKYYILQIASGVSYLHSKFILHCDLHPKNVLLKYNADASKTCMICDFGSSLIMRPDDVRDRFRIDVARVCQMVMVITDNFWPRPDASPEANEVYEIGRQMTNNMIEVAPHTINDLLQLAWFQTPGRAPIPRAPTPMLDDATVRRIGFLPQADATRTATSSTISPAPGPSGSVATLLPAATSRASLGSRIAQGLRSVRRTISRPFSRHRQHQRHCEEE